MRVISGSAKRLLLKTIEGKDTRPTTDRIKETLFNMMQNDIYGCTFLDLFSGSGAIGIEALSRGAGLAVMVENNKRAIECIRENLKTTRLEEKAMVMDCDVITALKRLEDRQLTFNIIFMDPPYNQLLEKTVLEYLAHSALIDRDTLIIAEASRETETDYLSELGFELVREKEYKTNKHLFITKGEN
ncbi:16S rRNA (guanine(966)-N(2))-methyltransferase RsmD [uncultured Clostridium sp.]|uniref:16S rRNA (guanine(966)-N(2))-methyltransferase RsmD n=1 Tax=uncultured Clostridium sp. TaxID=59620 RepID=UPI003457EA4C